MRLLLMSLLFILTSNFAYFAQNESFVNYSTKDGLPSSQVYDIIQDDFGFMWFSTDKGLSRYNGYEFQNYDTSDGLSDNVVFDFLKRPNGEIWCTTNSSSLFYFSGRHPRFTPYKFNDSLKAYCFNKITHSLYVSENEDVYLGFHDNFNFTKISKFGKILRHAAVYKFDPKNVDSTYYFHSIVDDSSDPFFFISDDRDTERKIGAPNVITKSTKVKINKTSRRFEAIHFEDQNTNIVFGHNFMIITSSKNQIYYYNDGEIIATGKLNSEQFWVGYRYGGVIVYDLAGKVINQFLPERTVTQLFEDSDGHLWISTLERGVYKISNQSMKLLDEIGDRHISAFSKGESNDFYIGGYDGTIFNRSSGGETKLFHQPKSRHKPVSFAFNEAEQHIYFANDKLFDLNRILDSQVHVDYIISIDDRFIGMGTFGLIILDSEMNEKTDFLDRIRTFDAVNFNNRVYVASSKGLYQIPSKNTPYSEKLILGGLRIDDLELFGDLIVLGTNGNGLHILDQTHRRKYQIKKSDGLTSDYINKTYTENDSTLWVCTNQGVNRIQFDHSRNSYEIMQLSSNDGLVSNEVWDILVFQDTLWVGTQNGVNFISINDFNKLENRKHNYFLQWKSILINDKQTPRKGTLAYDENKIEFNVLGISFGIEKDLMYRYKLVGLEDSWSYTQNRVITFSSLPPGSYEFIVNVRGKNKTWEENEIRYAFIISPPFWKTWWFIWGSFLLAGALVYMFFKIRVLTYNKDVVREFMRYILQKLRRDEPTITLRVSGKDIKVKTSDIYYIKTSGNYLEVYLSDRSHLIRSSISKFIDMLPDKIEFVQVHRSYIIRIDKVQQKGKDELIVLETTIPIGRMYLEQLKSINL